MSPGRDSTENLVEVNFGPSAVRIFSIVPVDDEDPHSEHADPAGIGVEDAIHESRAGGCPETFGETYGFLDDDSGGSFTAAKLGRAQSKH